MKTFDILFCSDKCVFKIIINAAEVLKKFVLFDNRLFWHAAVKTNSAFLHCVVAVFLNLVDNISNDINNFLVGFTCTLFEVFHNSVLGFAVCFCNFHTKVLRLYL